MFLASQLSGATLISVAGDLDLIDAAAFRKMLSMADHAEKLIVDLTRCRYIDSAAVSVLVDLYKTGRPLIVVCEPRSPASMLLDLTQLANDRRVVAYLGDALAVAS